MVEENVNQASNVATELPKGMAIAGMVCGIVGLLFSWVPILGLGLALTGVILGAKGMSAASKGEAGGKGMAIAGLVCGIIALIWSVLTLIFWITVASAAASVPYYY